MQRINKKAWIEIGICAAVFAALAIIAAFYDLAINKALYNPDSLYGQYFANLGELPSYLAAPAVGVIFFYQDFGKSKTATTVWKLACVALIFVGWLYAIGHWFWGNFVQEDLMYAAVYKALFSGILTLCLLLGCAKIDKKVMRKLLVLALFIAVVAALSNIIVQIMKVIWARQRFRTMIDTPKNAELIAAFVKDGDLYQGFSPWYKPTLIFKMPIRTDAYMSAYKAVDSDTFKSFPSGHTVAAAASFFVIILPDMYRKLSNYKWMFWALPAIYTVAVAISRIVMGAHYLSDVLFGGFIGFGVAAFARWLFVSNMDAINRKLDIPYDSKITVLQS